MNAQQRALADRMIADVRRSLGEPTESHDVHMMRGDDRADMLRAAAAFVVGVAGGAAVTRFLSTPGGGPTRGHAGDGA